MVEDDSAMIRGEAIRAISFSPHNNPAHSFDLLLSIFNNSTEDLIVRAYALEGLGYLGDRRALDTVIANLTSKSLEIRFMAAFALGEIGDVSHLPLLEALTTDEAFFETWGTVADEAKTAIINITRRSSCPL